MERKIDGNIVGYILGVIDGDSDGIFVGLVGILVGIIVMLGAMCIQTQPNKKPKLQLSPLRLDTNKNKNKIQTN